MDTSTAPASSSRRVVYLSNEEVYDRWASTYDTDGNILQSLDSYELNELLPCVLQHLNKQLSTPQDQDSTLCITDLGCGTGRASVALVNALQSTWVRSNTAIPGRKISLTCVDFSESMLAVARRKVSASVQSTSDLSVKLNFDNFDFFNDAYDEPRKAHAVLSTLVIEHLPLDLYFKRTARCLLPDGLLLLTNMHHMMGNTSFRNGASSEDSEVATGAGFVDADSNTKYRGKSYAHTIRQVQAAAADRGLKLIEPVVELSVEEWMLRCDPPLVGPRGRKWVRTPCWFGMIFRLGS